MNRAPLFWRELRAGRKTFFGWTIPSALLILLSMSAFPSVQEGMNMDEMVKSIPEGLRAALGFGKLSLNEAIGYFAGRSLFLIVLLGGLYTAIYGASLLAKEEGERTAEFLLTKPIGRNEIVLQKAGALLVYTTLHALCVSVVSGLSFLLFVKGPYSMTALTSLLLSVFFVVFSFGGLGFALSGFLSKTRSATSLALGGVMIAFIASSLSGVSDALSWLRWVSPFKYADPNEIVLEGLRWSYMAMLFFIGLAGIGVALTRYSQKEIHA